MTKELVNPLIEVFVNTYALYLKTQNYHWNVQGIEFYTLHIMLEKQYQELAEAVDELAERIVAKGHKLHSNFAYFDQLSRIPHANPSLSAEQMIRDLINAGHEIVVSSIKEGLEYARNTKDVVTEDILIERLRWHEKTLWQLRALTL